MELKRKPYGRVDDYIVELLDLSNRNKEAKHDDQKTKHDYYYFVSIGNSLKPFPSNQIVDAKDVVEVFKQGKTLR